MVRNLDSTPEVALFETTYFSPYSSKNTFTSKSLPLIYFTIIPIFCVLFLAMKDSLYNADQKIIIYTSGRRTTPLLSLLHYAETEMSAGKPSMVGLPHQFFLYHNYFSTAKIEI